jgi:peptidoglycan/LPS O-acetylase OafA/YrhL
VPPPVAHDRVFGLDVVRVAAVTLVLLAHGSYLLVLGGVHLLEPFVSAPHAFEVMAVFGVELFFVLSGWLVGGIIIDTVMRDARWLANFWLRRWLRTLPNYFLFLALNVLLFRAFHHRWPLFGPFLVLGQGLYWPHPQFFNEA